MIAKLPAIRILKFAHDKNTDQLLAWFRRDVPRRLRSLGLFDSQGLFIGDASYLFSPTARTLASQTWLGLGLLCWGQCPMYLTAVVNRERGEHGPTQDWVLSVLRIVFRPHRSVPPMNCAPPSKSGTASTAFLDLTGTYSCAFSLLVNQALMVRWTTLYSGADYPRVASAPETESRYLGTHLVTPLCPPWTW
jgi:hypothetical protein